jgi:ABC-2 type transport system ATP-binding protein
VLGYLGPNGAGKTTTIRLLLGLVNATRGRAEIFGVDCQANPVQAHRRVAYVPGEANLWPSLTGAETLHLLGHVQGTVDTVYRDALIERFDLDPSKKVRAYSKGNRQKLILIAGLMTRADLLLLDEPTAGLDPLMERTFRTCIDEARDRGQTVFLSSHILAEVEALCDRIAILRAGHLAEVGTLEQMRHLSALQVEAELDATAPDLSRIPGVSAIEIDGNRVRCQVAGPTEELMRVLVWGSETPIICLTCGFATRGGDERTLFRMPGKQAIGLRRPLPLGTKPWVHAEPFRAGLESVGLRSHPLRLGGQVPEAGPERPD